LRSQKKLRLEQRRSEKDELASFAYRSIAEAKKSAYPSKNPML
jgi:hypothetical protein